MLLFLCLPRYSRRIVRSSYVSLTCRLRRGSKTVGLQVFSEEGTEDYGICPRRPHRFIGRWDVHCRGLQKLMHLRLNDRRRISCDYRKDEGVNRKPAAEVIGGFLPPM